MPALFKLLTEQAGLDYDVSVEPVSGQGLDHHFTEKRALIDRAWDHVVMHGYSTLDRDDPGNPALLITSARPMADLLQAGNPHVNILLTATWSRAEQVYQPEGHWHSAPIEAMALDIRRAYDAAAAASPHIDGVVPVGEAWNRAFAVGFADPNPYDGIAAGQMNTWTHDSYHGSTAGYYLEALMVFGRLTGQDPVSLGQEETAARELGLSRTKPRRFSRSPMTNSLLSKRLRRRGLSGPLERSLRSYVAAETEEDIRA